MFLKGYFFLISGPSGVGKGTVINALKKHHPVFVFPLSHTTRPRRPGEKDGEVYHFISKKVFEAEIARGNFLEWAQVHGKDYYGTLKKPILEALEAGKTVIREVDVQGFHSISRAIPKKNLVTIFLKAESMEKLIARIAKRGKLPPEELKRRLESAQKELKQANFFDYQVWSLENKIPECVKEVENIILEQCRCRGLPISY